MKKQDVIERALSTAEDSENNFPAMAYEQGVVKALSPSASCVLVMLNHSI